MNQYCQNCGSRLNGEAYCPKCQNRVSSRPNPPPNHVAPEMVGPRSSDKPFHVTIVGHGIRWMLHFVFYPIFKIWHSDDLSVEIWTDGQYAGTVVPDGRIDLYFDKSPVEFRMCLKGAVPKGRWSTVLQSLEPRCCFRLAFSKIHTYGIVLRRIPVS